MCCPFARGHQLPMAKYRMLRDQLVEQLPGPLHAARHGQFR